jgi:hypothetical protein
MNGVAILVATAVLGVDYGWQPTNDGQLEYIIQIEPVTLVALRSGQELISQIDTYVQGIRRFRIRVGTEMVPRRGTPPRQPAPPQSLPIPSGVQYGWRGLDSQQMEFIIQLSHERLVLMRGGEELVGEFPAEVQNVTQLRIRSGVEPPPRQGLQTASANLPTEASVVAQPAAGGLPTAGVPPKASAQQPSESSGLPPAATDWPGQPTLALPQPPQTTDGEQRASSPPDGTWAADPRRDSGEGLPGLPVAPAADPRFENSSPRPATDSDWQTGPVPTGSSVPNQGPLTNPVPAGEPRNWERAPIGGAAQQNPAGAVIPGSSIYSDAPPTSRPDRVPVASPPVAPPASPTASVPYTPQWSSGNQPETTNIRQAPSVPAFPQAGSRPFDMTVAAPRMPWERRLFDDDRKLRALGQGGDFWSNLAATAQDPALAFLHSSDTPASGDRPWGPFALALMVLFVSLGANLYMGWIAMDMYQRYLELAGALTERDSPSSSHTSLDDDPLLEDDDWDHVPRRRSRATMVA